MSEAAPETLSINNPDGQPIIWTTYVDLADDEISPDQLAASSAMLISTLEDAVEADDAAADWHTFRLTLNPGYVASATGETVNRLAVTVSRMT